jgi:3-hydroxyacyl-[acyl-carrier-protein] dehydratase
VPTITPLALDRLSYRYPVPLVDAVVSHERGRSLEAVKSVTVSEDFFQGHFPGQPVMPGVLLVEGIAQTAGAICCATLARRPSDKPPVVYFMSIEQAKFRRPVVPGVTVEYHVKKLRHRGGVWKFSGEARVDGQKVAEAIVTAMVAD